jgi:3'-5' exoribonuclease
MKSPYLKEVEPDQLVTTILLVHSKEVRQKKKGEPYLSLVLGDRTGEIDSKMWDNVAEVMDTFGPGDFVKVKGLAQLYNNRLQFVVHKLRRLEESEVDLGDFFPASKRDPDEMFRELEGVIAGFRNPHLKQLLELIFADPEIAARYRRAPAAKYIHHAFLGGLLEHVLSLCAMCRKAADHYGSVDGDLLVAGAILHDIGKIRELTYERGFGYSTEGQLLGHIVIGLEIIGDKIRHVPDFPARLRTLVEHMVISHHGQLEFGSPKLPLFPEALLLHYLDDLDSKMECMRAMVEQDRQVSSDWTAYSNSMDRVILKKVKYLSGSVPEEEAEVAAPPPAQRLEEPQQTSLFAERLQQAWNSKE